MDEIVKAAMAKWPNVPDCFGWLALDDRGDWYMRDERTQRAGPFPQVKGSRVVHDKLREFIDRNYQPDRFGRWFFQNGPQRVFVELAVAPWVLRVHGPAVHTHTGQPVAEVRQVLVDEHGRLWLDTDLGLGLVHSQDVLDASEALEAGRWPQPQAVAEAQLPARFGFIRRPAPEAAPR